MRKTVFVIALLAVTGWVLSMPSTMTARDLPDHTPDVAAGEQLFWAGGCASCHASPVDGERAKGEAKLLLGGGTVLETPFGVFRVPNISSDADDGIGTWTTLAFVNAMQRGVAPDGKHYYPSFPYASYAKMPVEDVIDLKAFMDTLPAVSGRIADHELEFPWSIRRGLGVWKRIYVSADPIVPVNGDDERIIHGRQLVEGAGHCGECHTPRDSFGGMQRDLWLAGAPNPEGRGRIPNITPAGKAVGEWSEGELAFYFESGFTPDFDTVGGTMVAVQENLAKLSADDRMAIAAYLKSLPAIEADTTE